MQGHIRGSILNQSFQVTNSIWKIVKNFLLFILFVFFFLFYTPLARAADFKTDYFVDYYLSEKNNDIATKVSFKIRITNLTTDLVIKKFSIIFPKSFQIGNIKASDDFKDITPIVEELDEKHSISAQFSDPLVGINMENTLYLDFLQHNLFKANGNVWEVLLPTVERREEAGDYTITVHLPPNSGKQISISKPKPTHVTLDEIVWKNPDRKTIYAVFGKQQNYTLQLRYHLKNPRLTRVYTDVTFPPDTLYQKIFVSSIQPKPDEVRTDEDGNYYGRYYLNPHEEKTLYFNGGISIFSEPRENMKGVIRSLFNKSRKYLLSPSTHWKLETNQIPASITSPQEIYRYTTDLLEYNRGRLNSSVTRLGASLVLQNPDQAVCTEYSDVFVAVAREKGNYAREIQGYGFSNDQDLRPLSINSDILHSWSEYYDMNSQLWIPIDPTWEDTSGIDYLNSFDLNHIVFAIHGKKSDYPYPAGSYKTDDNTKDINILPTDEYFTEKKSLSFDVPPLQIPINTNGAHILKITVQNTGNSFIFNMPITTSAKDLIVSPSSLTIESLAPFEKKELTLEYKSNNKFKTVKTKMVLSSDSKELYEHEITLNSMYLTFLKYAIVGFAFCFFAIIAVKFMRK